MKKECLFKNVGLFLVMYLSLGLISCDKSDDEEGSNSRYSKYLLLADSEDETPYQLSLINAENRVVYLMNVDDNCNIYNIDVLYNNEQSMLNISFADNGLLECIQNDECSIVLSNHNGNKVDIAISYGDEMCIAKEVDLNINWDNYIKNDNIETRASTRVGLGKWFDNFADGYANSRFHKELYDKNSAVSLFIGQVKDIKDVVEAGIVHGAEASLSYVKDWMKDLVIDGVIDLGAGQEDVADCLTLIDYADKLGEYRADLLDDLKKHKAKLKFNSWDVFIDILGDYDRITDWFADQWLKFFEWQDEQEERERLAQAALRSGYGNLKITLSWNFYADIDLEVMEPDGNVIYWKKMKSSSGGYLDVDNRAGGYGAKENVFWKEPVNGRYHVYLNYYGASTYNNAKRAGYCMVLVMYHGVGKEYRLTMEDGDFKKVVEIDIPSGELYNTRSNNEDLINIVELNKDSK